MHSLGVLARLFPSRDRWERSLERMACGRCIRAVEALSANRCVDQQQLSAALVPCPAVDFTSVREHDLSWSVSVRRLHSGRGRRGFQGRTQPWLGLRCGGQTLAFSRMGATFRGRSLATTGSSRPRPSGCATSKSVSESGPHPSYHTPSIRRCIANSVAMKATTSAMPVMSRSSAPGLRRSRRCSKR